MSNLKKGFKYIIILICFRNALAEDINYRPCNPTTVGYLCKTNKYSKYYDGKCQTQVQGDHRISYCAFRKNFWYRHGTVRY